MTILRILAGALLAFSVAGAVVALDIMGQARPALADPQTACAAAHSEYIARRRSNGQCLQTPGCWIMAEDIHRMNQAEADAAAACPISAMTK